MKKLTIITLIISAVFPMFGNADLYLLPQSIPIALTLTGFETEKVERLSSGGWSIRAKLVWAESLSAQGVKIKPVRVDVQLSRENVATALGIDTSAENWLVAYNAVTIEQLNAGVIGAAQLKALSAIGRAE